MKNLLLLVILLAIFSCQSIENRVGIADTGHSTTAPKTQISFPNTLIWSKGLAFGAEGWRHEANRRFGPTCLLIICHGEQNFGEWWMYPDRPMESGPTQKIVENLRKEYKGRAIVLICCNPGGYELHDLPGVYYTKRTVLVPPYEMLLSITKWYGAAGDIAEFSSNE